MRRLRWLGWIVGVLSVSALVGCGGGGGGDGDDGPQARILFLHDATDLDTVELRADEVKLGSVAPGAIGPAWSTPTGLTTLSAWVAGVGAPIHQADLDLAQQTYLVALTGSFGGQSLAFETVAQVPPVPVSGTTALEVVSLYPTPFAFDVYVEIGGVRTQLADGIVRLQASPFATVDSGTADILVFNAGDDPAQRLPLISTRFTLADGRAGMVLIEEEGGAPTVRIVTVR